jgi:hypothetical protein
MERNGIQMEIRFGWMMLIILPLLYKWRPKWIVEI